MTESSKPNAEMTAQPVAAAPSLTNAVSPEPKKKTNCWLIGCIILVVLFLLGVGGAYAVYRFTKIQIPGVSSVLGPKLDPNCRYNDPNLCKFVNNWKTVDYMTMTSSWKDAAYSTDVKVVFKIQNKKNTQMIIEQNGKETSNSIMIDTVSYTKDYSDNKWFKYTIDPIDNPNGSIAQDFNFDTKASDANDKTIYKSAGTEACGNLTCFKYEIIQPDGTDVFQFIYFDNKEYKLRKMRAEYSNKTIAESTISYDKFTISEPSPIKEGSPLGTIPSAPTPSTSSQYGNDYNANYNSNSEVVNDSSVDTAPGD